MDTMQSSQDHKKSEITNHRMLIDEELLYRDSSPALDSLISQNENREQFI